MESWWLGNWQFGFDITSLTVCRTGLEEPVPGFASDRIPSSTAGLRGQYSYLARKLLNLSDIQDLYHQGLDHIQQFLLRDVGHIEVAALVGLVFSQEGVEREKAQLQP